MPVAVNPRVTSSEPAAGNDRLIRTSGCRWAELERLQRQLLGWRSLAVVGNMMHFEASNPGPLVFNRISVAGSLIGGVADTREVLDLCAEHGIRLEIQLIEIADINDAFARIKNEDVRFRHVIDMASLKAERDAIGPDREHLEAPTRGDPVNRKTASGRPVPVELLVR